MPSYRLALPSRVPPLGGKRALTPELRSITTPEIAIENIAFTPEVIDQGESLDNYSFKAVYRVQIILIFIVSIMLILC